MTLQELARRAPFIIAAVVGAGAILGCALLAGTVAYLTKPLIDVVSLSFQER